MISRYFVKGTGFKLQFSEQHFFPTVLSSYRSCFTKLCHQSVNNFPYSPPSPPSVYRIPKVCSSTTELWPIDVTLLQGRGRSGSLCQTGFSSTCAFRHRLPSDPETSSSRKQLEEPEYELRNTPLAALMSTRFLDLCGYLKADEGFMRVIETVAWGKGIKQSCDLYKMWRYTRKYSKATQSSSNLIAPRMHNQAYTGNMNISSMASHLSYSRSYGMITSLAVETCLDLFLCLFLTLHEHGEISPSSLGRCVGRGYELSGVTAQ